MSLNLLFNLFLLIDSHSLFLFYLISQSVLFLKNAEIAKGSYHNKPNSISLKCEGKKALEYLIFDSTQQQQQLEWFKALEKAVIWHEEERKRLNAPLQYRTTLGIPLEAKLTQNMISKAFRKLSLKVLLI